MKKTNWLVIASFVVFLVMELAAVRMASAALMTVKIRPKDESAGTVTLSPNGKGGTSVCSSNKCETPTDEYNYTQGTVVNLTAKPSVGYIFIEWKDGCSGNSSTTSVKAGNNAVTCKANFQQTNTTTTTTTSSPTTTQNTTTTTNKNTTTTPPTTTTTTTSTTTTTLALDTGESLEDFSALPPFMGIGDVPPNVLIILDRSSSMDGRAYDKDSYSTLTTYYGYFESNKCYAYTSLEQFDSPTPTPKAGGCPSSNPWNGNFLNWLTMSRLDATKWALTGGRCKTDRSEPDKCPLFQGEVTTGGGSVQVDFSAFTGIAPTTIKQSVDVNDGLFKMTITGSSEQKTFQVRVVAGERDQTGVIQRLGSATRIGVMLTDGGTDIGAIEKSGKSSDPSKGAYIDNYSYIEDKTKDESHGLLLVRAVDGAKRRSGTPLYQSLYLAARYFAQYKSPYNQGAYTVGKKDPYCFHSLNPSAEGEGCSQDKKQGAWVYCCNSYVLLFTDGEQSVNKALTDSDGKIANMAIHITKTHDDLVNKGSSDHKDEGNNPKLLDDVAFWAHTTDLRPEGVGVEHLTDTPPQKGLPEKQTLTLYTIFAFGDSGQRELRYAATTGGFVDKNGNGAFDPGEDKPRLLDKDGDGIQDFDDKNKNGVKDDGETGEEYVPYNYFEASNAYELKSSLTSAFTDILRNNASGSAASVVASSASGEGVVYQPYFLTERDSVSWVGYLQSLFLDNKGRLREDTIRDGALVLNEDRIVEVVSEGSKTVVKVYELSGEDKSGGTPKSADIGDMPPDFFHPLWEAGQALADRDISVNPRKIYTSVVEGDNKQTRIRFSSATNLSGDSDNSEKLQPYLRAVNKASAVDIIDFIRGDREPSGFRKRTMNGKIWRLGDIVYSNPISVGAPAERISDKYGDKSYAEFRNKYAKRRTVVYVGANDGALHAFNGGFLNHGNNPATGKQEQLYFGKQGKGGETERPLGEEIWAFIPQELLPHLRWLTQDNYTKGKHVAYVDGSSRIADVQSFTPDAIHPGGWGTILIGSMRMGGGLIKAYNMNKNQNNDNDTDDDGEGEFRSSYFALDITDPEGEPEVLWSFNDKDLGFTTSFPAIMRLGKGDWYAVFGSGPTSYDGKRITDTVSTDNKFKREVLDNNGFGYVYAVSLNGLNGAPKFVWKKEANSVGGSDKSAFMGDPISFDLDNDYITDVVYIGKTFGQAGEWKGKMHRILTQNSPTTNNWSLSTLFNPEKPVLVPPTLSRDVYWNPWVYFGTGRFFSAKSGMDVEDKTAQAFYGVRDICWDTAKVTWTNECTAEIKISSIANTTPVQVKSGGKCSGSIQGVVCGSGGVNSIFDLADALATSTNGWVLDLGSGERVLSKAIIGGGVVIVPSFTPAYEDKGNVCKGTAGNGKIYALYYRTGTAFASPKHYLGAIDLETVKKPDGTQEEFAQKSVATGAGQPSTPTIVTNEGETFATGPTSQNEWYKVSLRSDMMREGSRLFREGID